MFLPIYGRLVFDARLTGQHAAHLCAVSSIRALSGYARKGNTPRYAGGYLLLAVFFTILRKPIDNSPNRVYNEYRRTNVRYAKGGSGTVWRLSRRRDRVAALFAWGWATAPWHRPKSRGGDPAARAQKRPQKQNEVTILVLGDWQRLAQDLPPDTPVIFRYDGKRPMETEDYCDGLRAAPSHLWEGHEGWRPCILVELGERF